MLVNLNWERGVVLVTREPGDPPYYGVKDGAGESRLLYAVKNALRLQGYTLIKKRMWKDGHLMDDMQQYIRTASREHGFAIYNMRWAIEGAEVRYNAGAVELALVPY